MNFKLKAGAFAPIRAHKQDAGVDLLSPVTVTIYPGDSATIDTGVCAEKRAALKRNRLDGLRKAQQRKSKARRSMETEKKSDAANGNGVEKR